MSEAVGDHAASTADTGVGDAMLDRIIRLGRSLQMRGVDIAMTEMIDAGRAATMVDLSSRDDLRTALRSTLIKYPRHHEAFEAAFDRWFPARPPRDPTRATRPSPTDAAEVVASRSDLSELAAALVDEHAGLDGELRTEGHHIKRAYRGADLARLMSEARRADPAMAIDDVRARIEELKRLMAADVRAQLGGVDDRPASQLEDVEFLAASRLQLDAMRSEVEPLARKLATRLARRRQSVRSGRVNMRRTVRLSLGTGGVPLTVARDRPRAHRPELFVLCDISGSVADFSLFTLTLMSALSVEIPRSRSFVFVDAVDEVTELLRRTDHAIEPWQLLRNANVIGADGHSDYGAVFEQFWEQVGDRDLRSRSTVIVTGDARSNYRPANVRTLRRIAGRCGRLYWFNPEPASDWETHDSEMSEYATCCSGLFEVRNLRQLVRAVEQVL